MDKAKPMIGKLSIEEKTNQVSGPSKNAIEDRRISLKMVQNILLIWLDNNIDDNSTNCRNTITQLRCAVNTIKIFTDAQECIEFLESSDNEKACMIISGSLGQHMVSRVHNMSQVDSIFIYCDNKQHHEQWAKEWYKIKGVFTEMTPIYETLKQVARQYEQNAIPISFMATSGDISKKHLDQLEPSFMYTQILKEILLTIEFSEKHFEEFISYCHDALSENEGELKNVDEFRRNYRSETPIWWYSYPCFLYSMLNRALRLMDVDVIIKMGFFMGDLHRHIEQLYKEQFDSQNFGTSFTVYRGQGMSKSEFEQMTKIKGGLISFNSFLSTSKNHDVSLLFAESNQSNPNLVGILFVMKIDSSQSSAPFASINSVSYFQTEEVLFSMHTIFRICEIKSIGESDRLFQVELTLTSDNDKDLHQLTDRIREETEKSAGWAQLGELLLKLGQNEKAQQIYQRLLNQATNESEKAPIYQQLAQAKYNLGEYKEAIIINEKALEIRQPLLPPNHPDVAKSYNNIGTVYYSIAEYSKSLSSHEKALEIQQHSLPSHHPHLAASYNNIGNVYYRMGEYSKALSSYEKAVEIKQQSLPSNHPDLAASYNNIGNVYYRMGEYSKALSSYEKAVEIKQKSLPPNHPDLAASYNNIGNVYYRMGEYSKALSSHEKALEIGQQSFSPIHSDLADSYKNIGFVYYSMREY
jgi:tetratricopeptide (TPR) repeat protein